jgi:hypothetical protein
MIPIFKLFYIVSSYFFLHNSNKNIYLTLYNFSTRVEKSYNFLLGKFFGIFKNGQKKCPKFERQNILLKNICLCYHILKL